MVVFASPLKHRSAGAADPGQHDRRHAGVDVRTKREQEAAMLAGYALVE